MKKIVIIGASSGLGQRIATDFAYAGWRVGMAARSEEPLRKIKQQFPGNTEYLTIDVTAQDAVKRFYELIELIDGMDVLLYASGVGYSDPELKESKLINTLEVNVVGFARILSAAYKYFKRTANNGRGQIAAITSVAGTRGIGVSAAYSSSKRFQQQFIQSLDQLAYNQKVAIDFTDIRPGFVRTPLLNPDRNYPMLMTVEYAAPLIEKAILRRKRVATIDWRYRLLTAAWRMIPESVWRKAEIQLI